MKILFRRIHLYLAFAAGLVIMVTCATGALLVFEKELEQMFHKERYFSTPSDKRVPVDELVNNLKNQVPNAQINSIRVYSEPGRNTEISFINKVPEENKKQVQHNNPGKPQKQPAANARLVAFSDPYSGGVVAIYNHRESFFYFVMDLHRWLLGGDSGKMIVGICTLVFLFILLTGIILWWPKTRNVLKQRVKIKWTGGWKRLNHDLHIVLGFYSALLLFIFAFTGLAWSFTWFNKGIFKITNSSMAQPKAPKVDYSENTATVSYEAVFQHMQQQVPGAVQYNITAPKDSIAPFIVNVLPSTATHESAMDIYYINRYQPAILQEQLFSQRNLGQKVRATFKPIHTAGIWGTPSKIIGLIVCIFGVIFPVTGYIMWWLRTSGKSKNKG